MNYIKFDDIEIAPLVDGVNSYTKVSYPIRYGRYSEVRTKDHLYQFNLKGEISFIAGRNGNWPNPLEWLKRTVSNDWVYYSSGGYAGLFSIIGEHYYPCFSYATNSMLRINPFKNEDVIGAIDSLPSLYKRLESIAGEKDVSETVSKILLASGKNYSIEGHRFHTIIGGRISVLPPDARHVDYDVIPVIISDGCLYNCGFCSVKSGLEFKERKTEEIFQQIENLKEFYGENISNYNSIFLGQHDALYSDIDLITETSQKAFDRFNFKNSYMKDPKIFMFGSVESILKVSDEDLKKINKLPFYTYVNIGLESYDQETLDFLKKPLKSEMVLKAFERMVEINRKFPKIEITSNFIYGKNLPENHYNSIMELLKVVVPKKYNKGDVYFSYFNDGGDRGEMQREFFEIKNSSNLPAYTYLIQRL